MKITIDMKDEELRELILAAVSNQLHIQLNKSSGIKAIRDGTRDYLMRYNLFEFVNLLKQNKGE